MGSTASTEEIENAAIELVAQACASVPLQIAMAAAIARHAGNVLAKLTSAEDAFMLHTRLARRHQVRMSQVPGARRR